MGTHIDRIVFSLLGTAVLYLFFLNAWGSIPLAAVLALICAALARALIRMKPPRRRPSAARLRGELLRLAGLTDAQAQAEMAVLVKSRWPGEDFALAPVLKHPEATLTGGDLLNAWKANREAEKLVVCATCPAEPRALAYARELRAPTVAVVDSRKLCRIMKKALPPEAPVPLPSPRERLRRIAARVASSRVTPKNALLAAALLLMYLRGGNPLCLFASLAILAHFGVAIAQRRMGRKLFDM